MVKPLHKECSIKERDNTSKVSKQRKQLIWNLKFHADTAAIFSQSKRREENCPGRYWRGLKNQNEEHLVNLSESNIVGIEI